MNKVRMPDFTAELSLSSVEGRYRTVNMRSDGPNEQTVIPQLRCLEWHCQGTECICIRFTTELRSAGFQSVFAG